MKYRISKKDDLTDRLKHLLEDKFFDKLNMLLFVKLNGWRSNQLGEQLYSRLWSRLYNHLGNHLEDQLEIRLYNRLRNYEV
jgi:hypothetical protein